MSAITYDYPTQGVLDRRGRIEPDVETLARALIEYTTRSNEPGEPTLLLDCEIDGVRLLLVQRGSAEAPKLSPRELEIGHLVSQGFSNKMIAATLDISPMTVSTHVRRIFEKLGVRTRSAMVARLLDLELLARKSA
jgi:DNA-binding NarL/FixJ family response regulator